MESLAPDTFDRRISKLESSSRRDRVIGLAMLALAFATAQAPAPPAAPGTAGPVVVRDATGGTATLTASGLTVRDKNGRERSFTGIDSEGKPSLDLSDDTGRLRESMYLLDGVPILRQFDSAGKRRAEIRIDNTGDGELLLSDQTEKLRLALFRTSKGDPQLGLYGSDEKLRAYFSTDDDSPYLVMKDRTAQTRVYVGGYTDGKIGIDVRDTANKTLWSAP